MIEPSLPPTREEGFHSALLLPALPLLVFCPALFVPRLASGFQILLVLHPLVFHLAHAPFVNSLIFLQTLSAYLCGFRAMNVYALTSDPLLRPCGEVRPVPTKTHTRTYEITRPLPARTRQAFPTPGGPWPRRCSGSGLRDKARATSR